MNVRYLLIVMLALLAQQTFAASMPVYTTEPADPENFFKINFINFHRLNTDNTGLFYARGEYSSTDAPTYETLAPQGRASFWIPAPLDFSQDTLHALVTMNYPGWFLQAGGYIENANTWRLLLPLAPNAFPDFNLVGAKEMTISMSFPSFVADINPYTQHMLVGLSLSADNGLSKALLFDWTLRAVPEPATGMLLTSAGALGAILCRRKKRRIAA